MELELALAAVEALVAEESEGGCGWTNVLVTRVVLLLLHLSVVAVVPLVLLVMVTAVAEVAEVAPRVVAVVGSSAHGKGLAGSGCGIPVVPELGSVPRRMLLPP